MQVQVFRVQGLKACMGVNFTYKHVNAISLSTHVVCVVGGKSSIAGEKVCVVGSTALGPRPSRSPVLKSMQAEPV
jgi:hypothetical protein